jgi:16S rRNA processing protein RimM
VTIVPAARPRTATRLRAAQVRRPHGVRGELRVETLGGAAERFAPGLRLYRESDGAAFTVCFARPLGADQLLLLALEEVTTREQAEAMREQYLCVDPTQARPLAGGEWFVHQLVGLRVEAADGRALGTVADVEHYVGGDVLVISDQNGERRMPMAHAFVERVDVEAGVMVVTPWEEEQR